MSNTNAAAYAARQEARSLIERFDSAALYDTWTGAQYLAAGVRLAELAPLLPSRLAGRAEQRAQVSELLAGQAGR
jgi:hypothetical protein